MTQQEGRIAAYALLVKINVITGWDFPLSDKQQDVLVDQFSSVLIEKYHTCNTEEVEYAFRNYPVNNWGKILNLTLINEVMTPYLEKRYEASMIEQQLKERSTLPAPKKDPMSDDDFLEMNKNIWKGSKLWGLISTKCYDILVKRGVINLTNEEKEVLKGQARKDFFIYADEVDKKYKLNLRHDEQERFIIQNAKKLATCKYFERS